MRQPFAHQLTALEWSQNRPRPAFFLDTRLGKCLIATRWWQQWRSDAVPCLVVCPRQVLSTWEDEFAAEGIPCVRLQGSNAQMEVQLRSLVPVFVTHYEAIRTRYAPFAHPWRCLIADESTAIRNGQAKRTQTMLRLAQGVPFRAILSGMPNPDSDLDFFSQFLFLTDEFMGYDNYWRWRLRECRRCGFDWLPKHPAAIQAWVKRHAFRMTRQQAGVGNIKLFENRDLDLPRELTGVYREAEDDWLVQGEIRIWAPVINAYLRKLTGGCGDPAHPFKVKELLRCVHEELGKGEQFLVWCFYQSESTALDTAFRRAGLAVRRIRGDTPLAMREERIRAFQRGDLQGLVIQQKCGRFGLNLSAADTAYYFSNSLEPEDRSQSEDRVIHPAKTTPGCIVDLTTVGTVDEDVRRVLREHVRSSRSLLQKVLVRVHARRKGVA